ncbi:MAG: glycosyltransferase [Fimbriimonadales bacterium]|nr:glycosyltransferase [Fimbriimonadales bacterium]
MKPLISVLINNYNYARFLPDAIESALAQTYPHKEIIVVDDGSTDHSREVLRQYEGQVQLVLKENGGQASAFHAGFAAAQGEVICFLDSDDYWAPSLLERVASVWRDGLAIVEWRMECVNAEGKPLGKQLPTRLPPRGDLRPRLLRQMFYPCTPTSANAFSRRALQSIFPLDEGLWRISADLPIVLAAPFYGALEFIDEPLAYYRLHGANLFYEMPMDWTRLERETRQGLAREQVIRRHAARQGLKPHPRLGYSLPQLNLYRLMLLLAGRALPEMRNDTRLKLAVWGTEAVLRTDTPWSLRERWGYIRPLWASLIAPRKALCMAARWIFWSAGEGELRRFLSNAGKD